MWQSVCCMLLVLMVGASTVQSQEVRELSPNVFLDTDRSMERLESRLSSIEDQLNRMQRIVSTLNNPSIKENCTIDLSAYGVDDPTKYGYIRTSGGSSEELYVPEDISRYRGVTTVELDATTCTTRNRRRFDTHQFADDRLRLLEALKSAAAGTIIIGVSADSAERDGDFQNGVGWYFNNYGINLAGMGFRDKLVFIMQIGYPKKSLYERKFRYGDSLRMRIVLRGSSIYDVTFNRA